jgi:hypothetical protein
MDVSATGVAVSSELQPPIGMPLAIGSCVGRVLRVFPSGFAVRFVDKQDIDELMRLIVRNDPTNDTAGGSRPTKAAAL